MQKLIRSLAVVLVVLIASTASAQEWGNLKGKFLYKGKAPAPAKPDITKDKEYCGKFNVIDQSLLVNPENNGLANVIVYLYLSRGDKQPAVHPSYKDAAPSIVLDNMHCMFEPYVTLLWTEQELKITNTDTIGHNTKIDTLKNTPTNFTVPAGGELTQEFKDAETVPSKVSCSIHPWMGGLIVIKDNPYMAITDKNGEFEIKNIPAGDWTFQIYHEKVGYVDNVSVDGKKTSWRRGRYETKIGGGKTVDLGTVEIDAAEFK